MSKVSFFKLLLSVPLRETDSYFHSATPKFDFLNYKLRINIREIFGNQNKLLAEGGAKGEIKH
ncbi:hypothetical protein NIES4103_10290 [Nostoc sp. NIES-4103]|nr:hypothetical protein NIES4103_10290 [Nostoc sp. NIES-4103]